MNTTLDTTQHTKRRDDAACQSDACKYLQSLIGGDPDDIVWDHDHHLQGHAHCLGHEIIVIAPRDTQHHTVVLTPDDWAAIRRISGPDRNQMLRACAIDSRSRLMDVLAA